MDDVSRRKNINRHICVDLTLITLFYSRNLLELVLYDFPQGFICINFCKKMGRLLINFVPASHFETAS